MRTPYGSLRLKDITRRWTSGWDVCQSRSAEVVSRVPLNPGGWTQVERPGNL